jgi:hypothetical protein
MLRRYQSYHSYRPCWIRLLFPILVLGVLSPTSGCRSTPDYNKVIQQGTVLASSASKAEQVFGWSAISAALSGSGSVQLSTDAAKHLESMATQANTPESLKALANIYSTHQVLRDQALYDTNHHVPSKDKRTTSFYAAGLSLLQIGPPASQTFWSRFSRSGSQITPVGVDTRDVAGQLLEVQKDTLTSNDDKLISALVAMPDREHFLATLLLLQDDQLRGKLNDVRIVESVSRCAALPQTDPFNKLLSDLCADTYLKYFKQRVRSHAFYSVPNPSIAYAASAPLANRELEAWANPSSTLTLNGQTLTPAILRPIPDFQKAIAKQYGANDDYRCFGGGNLVPSGSNASACFQKYTENTKVGELPGVPVTVFGVHHYTYTHGGSANVRYGVRFGFAPAAETNWVLMRFQPAKGGTASDGIKCEMGCRWSTDPDVVEPGTHWAVFSVVPGATLQIAMEFAATVDPNGPNFFTLPYKEGIQIAELNRDSLANFTTVDPVEIVKLSDANPLISYISGLQKSLQPANWLLPQVDDVARAAELGESRMLLLDKLANSDNKQLEKSLLPPLIDGQSDTYQHALWRERKTFLAKAIPNCVYRISEAYKQPVELRVAFATTFLPDVTNARDHLSKALDALDKLSRDNVSSLLKSASDIAGVKEASGASPSQDTLLAEVFGAQEAVSNVQHNLLTTLSLSCSVLSDMKSQSKTNSLPWTDNSSVESICDK